MTINELIVECTKRGFPLTLGFNTEKDRIEYEIHIGSKTGIGTLYEDDTRIFLATRYDTINEIFSFDSIADVAYRWFDDYKDREPFTNPDPKWLEYFKEQNWVKSEVEVITRYIPIR